MQVQPLGQEDPLEEGITTHPSIYSFLGNPMNTGAWKATVHGVAKSRKDMTEYTGTLLLILTCKDVKVCLLNSFILCLLIISVLLLSISLVLELIP